MLNVVRPLKIELKKNVNKMRRMRGAPNIFRTGRQDGQGRYSAQMLSAERAKLVSLLLQRDATLY